MFKKIVGLGFSSSWKNKKSIPDYISSLVASWAWEFFTWYNPSYWHEKFGFEVSPNGRFAEHEQITDLETLTEIVQEVHKHGLEIFINLNAWYYTDETFEYIERMVQEFQSLKIDGIICGNIWILEYLKEIWYAWKINISTILALYNTEAIHFFLENYSINKIILSREVTLKEIENLVTNFPQTEFEVFGEGDFCRYNNWLCYAEHKYWAKDICTVVVNDLVFKKRYNPNFKSIILNQDTTNEEKVAILDDNYQDAFEQIEELTSPLYDVLHEDQKNIETLEKLVYQNRKRVDLFFDAMQSIQSDHNKQILNFLKWVKKLLEHYLDLKRFELSELQQLHDELEHSVKTWIQTLASKTKQVWGLPKLRAEELAKFYAKWDNLNLYTYLFFSQFHNINTVKFPTRGRNYSEKIQLIESVLQEKQVSKKYIARDMSLVRAHYDLSYVFWDKQWFRKLLQEF